MAQDVINKINSFKNFYFCEESSSVIHTGDMDFNDIDSFCEIQEILDRSKLLYKFKKGFCIQILKNKGGF